MTRYLLDTNHLSAYLDRHSTLEARVDACFSQAIASELYFRCCASIGPGSLPVADIKGIWHASAAQEVFRLWPVDLHTAAEFGNLFRELRQGGRVMSQFDLLIAAAARQYSLTVLTADGDFQAVPHLKVENWLLLP